MTSYLSFFLVLCYIFLLPSLNEANQSDQLKKLIKSQKAFPSSNSQYLSSLSSSRSFSPVHIGRQKGMMEADKIQELPGQPAGVDFNQYAGHVTVDPKNGRAFFYYFVESPQNSSSKPLLLWLNGGPGCSSMGYGAMEEHGPFRVNSDGKTLTRNEYAWNNVANVIYLESPTGVGFSYSNTSSDYKDNGDKKTAADNYLFLVNWLERFPQYKTRDFYITGESYAGHYIPELAYNIIQNNKVTNQTVINLRGVAIGNAYIDRESNVFGIYQFYWGHALISDDTYAKIQSSCNFANRIPSIKCDEAVGTAAEELGSIDDYNIYAPLCDGTNTQSDSGMPNFDPCSDDYVNTYLNSPAVQKALHATVTKTVEWDSCSDFPYIDRPDTVLPIIQELISSGLTLWLFSGDVDSVVPITSTRYSIKKLGLPVKTSWRPWYFNEEVGGYVEEYKGLTLATIRGAGHMVPSYQSQRALAMISSFLKGQLPPSGNK